MSTLSPIPSAAATANARAGAAPAEAPASEDRLAGAARQFEAIFVRQMLAAARATHFDEGGLFSGQAMGTFRQMQDERFADIASERGAFGLGAMIQTHLARLAGETKEPG